MTYSPVTASVFASPITAPYTINTKHPLNETAATALNIGNLQEQGDTINISDAGQVLGTSSSTNISLNQGDAVSFNLASLGTVLFDQQGNVPDIQLTDGQGNVVADSQGTTAQQQAFLQLVNGGLSPGAGNYTLTVTPPNITPGGPSATLTVNSQQGTRLNVNSQLTSGDPSEYYNFSFSSGSALKLAFDAGASLSSTRVQLYDSTGNLVADSYGNSFLKNNFAELTSATGLNATPGNYSAVVSYAPGTAADQNLNYNFQLYSGNSYSVDYQTNATAQSANNSAAASVSGSTQTAAYTRNTYNTVLETPTNGVNIGWLQQDKTSLIVNSQITSFDNNDYFNFTLQTGNNLKFAFANKTNTANLRVQILDGSGTQVIADNYGTASQQKAYAELTSSTGLTAPSGQYVVRVGYAVKSNATQTYNFQLYSGSSYSSQYTTTASAQTYENALLSGDISGGYTASGAAASYLTGLSNGVAPDILGALAATVGAATITGAGEAPTTIAGAAAAYLNNNLNNSPAPATVNSTLTTVA